MGLGYEEALYSARSVISTHKKIEAILKAAGVDVSVMDFVERGNLGD